MLHSRNRKLKRISRFVGFFIIVGAGCYYRLKENLGSVSTLINSKALSLLPLDPSFFGQQTEIEERKSKGITGHRLPQMDIHEFRYLGMQIKGDEEQKSEVIKQGIASENGKRMERYRDFLKGGGKGQMTKRLTVYRFWIRRIIFH